MLFHLLARQGTRSFRIYVLRLTREETARISAHTFLMRSAGTSLVKVMVAALLIAQCGCASLRPPDPESFAEQTNDEKHEGCDAAWYCLGLALQIIGPWLADRR